MIMRTGVRIPQERFKSTLLTPDRLKPAHFTRLGCRYRIYEPMKEKGTSTLLKMGRYYSTIMCYYWDMSVK